MEQNESIELTGRFAAITTFMAYLTAQALRESPQPAAAVSDASRELRSSAREVIQQLGMPEDIAGPTTAAFTRQIEAIEEMAHRFLKRMAASDGE